MNTSALFQFYMWVAKPTTLYSLETILKKITDRELLNIMRDPNSKQALTVAWAEYGRRNAFVDLKFEMKTLGVLEVQATNLVVGHGVVASC